MLKVVSFKTKLHISKPVCTSFREVVLPPTVTGKSSLYQQITLH